MIDYKSKYLKYKLKYLKITGGMENIISEFQGLSLNDINEDLYNKMMKLEINLPNIIPSNMKTGFSRKKPLKYWINIPYNSTMGPIGELELPLQTENVKGIIKDTFINFNLDYNNFYAQGKTTWDSINCQEFKGYNFIVKTYCGSPMYKKEDGKPWPQIVDDQNKGRFGYFKVFIGYVKPIHTNFEGYENFQKNDKDNRYLRLSNLYDYIYLLQMKVINQDMHNELFNFIFEKFQEAKEYFKDFIVTI